jgi:uncharacterized membrane protein
MASTNDTIENSIKLKLFFSLAPISVLSFILSFLLVVSFNFLTYYYFRHIKLHSPLAVSHNVFVIYVL